MIRKTFLALATLAMALMAISPAAASDVVTVTENGDGGFYYNLQPPYVTEVEYSLDAASRGTSSLYVKPIDNTETKDAKFIGGLFQQSISPTDFTASVDFQLAEGVTDYQHFYINVYAKEAGNPSGKWYDCRYDYVATSGSDETFTTLDTTGDATVVVDRLDDLGGDCGTSVSDLSEGATIFQVVVNVGDTGEHLRDQGVGGYLDNFQISEAGRTTTYDFEVPTPVKDDCKNGGHADLGFANQGDCVSALQANANAGKTF